MDDLSLACSVTSGSCSISDIDLNTQTAVVDWQTGTHAGSEYIEFSLGNGRFFRKTTDFVEIE
jgi:hypothetical protein